MQRTLKTLSLLMVAGLLAMLMLTGCARNVSLYKQAQKQYNSGAVEPALGTVVQSLQLKPSYVKAQNLIDLAYPKVIQNREAGIASLEASTQADKWDKIVVEYAALEEIQAKVKKLPILVNEKTGKRVELILKDYQPAAQTAKQNAAEAHYQKGLSLSRSSQNVDTQKQAAKEFKAAMSFIPNYKDSAAQYEKARQAGIKRIAIIPFEDGSGTDKKFGDLPAVLVDRIVSSVMSDPESREFVEIMTRAELGAVLAEQRAVAAGLVDEKTAVKIGQLSGAHEILTGKINQVISVPMKVYSTNESESKRLVTGKEEYVDENGNTAARDVYSDVTCSFTKYVKTANAQITGSYSIIDVTTGTVKKTGTFTTDNPWSETWGKVDSGDPKALSTASLNLCKKTEPVPPTDIELVSLALSKLSQQFVIEFKQYIK
ncbi:MAG TPA: CsgG/HfaB family protein [Candidatus Cloacimonadota bacterium]|nr:CsgG/HfaB family protein [Candidatus Cloacimonadota bacterium]